MRSGSTVLGLATFLLSVTIALPAEAQVKVRGTARLGAEAGGDKVVEFQYEDGSTPDVTAGGGLLLTAGASIQLLNMLDAQLNAGWKYRTIPEATNQSASWSRFPVEALLFYHMPMGLRLGGGTTVHLHNVLEASGGVLNSRIEFKSKPGFLLQAEYVMRNISVDVRYTIMKYEATGNASGSVNANSIGAGFSFLFGS